MSELRDAYNIVYASVKKFSDEISDAIAAGQAALSVDNGDIDAKIAEYEEQIKNIEITLPQIEDLLLLSQKYIGHRTLPTIEAPKGYRVNIRRLKMWAQMIDPLPKDPSPEEDEGDPYAQRIYLVATCDKYFLEKKHREFSEKIRELEQRKKSADVELANKAKARVEDLKNELLTYFLSKEFRSFADEVISRNKAHSYTKPPVSYRNPMQCTGAALGTYSLELPVPEGELRQRVLKILGSECYDEITSRVILPYVLDESADHVVSIICETAKTGIMDKGLQNYMLDLIERSPAGSNRICIFDCARYKSSGLGILRPLEDSFAVAPIPRSGDQVSAALEKLSCEFDDIDEVMESNDTLLEYNMNVAPDKRKPRTTMLLIGWPNSFQPQDRELINRMMMNHERYGITCIAVSFAAPGSDSKRPAVFPDYVEQTAIHIEMKADGITICDREEKVYPFHWYAIGDTLNPEYDISLRRKTPEKKTLGNDYTEHFDMVNAPVYTRKYKPLTLPYGVDGKDKLCSISFENENFAAFLMGASRSGKSTLLHTLISGIIANYHPDNVELWLADFKQLEFKKYMEHCPPHVKYILLDESTELVYDLIDKLTEKMMERQRLFASKGKERIDQIDTSTLSEPLPLIFVILDEFSIMSQSVADSEIYKIRLQNLLAKGAALGIRFLFSSQTFTTGVTGLTRTARAQIQQRIAMKGKRDEIEETLELSSADKTERVKNWMNALPPHYALVKQSRGLDVKPDVERVHVLYFPDAKVRDDYIETINHSMQRSDVYQPGINNAYVDKRPVMVDGNSYLPFDAERISRMFAEYRRENSDIISGGDLLMTLGTPRRMTETEYVTLYNEARENVLLIAPNAETVCAMSIVWTVAESCRMQGANVSVWAYNRNRLYHTFRNSHFSGCSVVEGMDAVCDAIRELNKKIRSHQSGNDIILLLGMEQFCMDFEYFDASSAEKDGRSYASYREALEKSSAVVHTDEQKRTQEAGQAWIKKRREIKKQLQASGMAADEIEKTLKEECAKFMKSCAAEIHAAEKAPAEAAKPAEEPKPEEKRSGAYNAKEDFAYVIKHGSRMGYHFVMVLNSVSDIKQCGMRPEFFRHKLSFQVSADDSRTLFNKKWASALPEHICQYDNGTDHYSFRPYLHKGVVWDGWMVDENGKAISPLSETT